MWLKILTCRSQTSWLFTVQVWLKSCTGIPRNNYHSKRDLTWDPQISEVRSPNHLATLPPTPPTPYQTSYWIRRLKIKHFHRITRHLTFPIRCSNCSHNQIKPIICILGTEPCLAVSIVIVAMFLWDGKNTCISVLLKILVGGTVSLKNCISRMFESRFHYNLTEILGNIIQLHVHKDCFLLNGLLFVATL